MRCVARNESSDGVTVFSAIDRDRVLAAVSDWAAIVQARARDVRRIGLFGSYARGDYAPGSDVDLLIVVAHSDQPVWYLRAARFDTSALPVGADVFVYTQAEVERMQRDNPWLRHVLTEAIWLPLPPARGDGP